MKITEVIKKLEEIKDDKGDLDCKVGFNFMLSGLNDVKYVHNESLGGDIVCFSDY